MRRLLALLALLPGMAFAQTAVKVYTTDSVTSAALLNALNATAVVAMAGKSSAGFVVTAVSSPLLTTIAETSRDGTNWDQHQMVDMDNGNTTWSTVGAAHVVGYTKTIILGGGIRYARIRCSAYTSGSVTVTIAATDTVPNALLSTHETTDGSGQPTAATNGTFRVPISSLEGVQFVRNGGPVRFACSVNNIAATLTQCQAAPGAGLSLYVTDLWWQSTTTTAGTGALQYGTGSNCGTGTTALLPASATANRYGYPASSTAATNFSFTTPLKVAANNALCIIGVATNTVRADILGYVAP
jgi:hypothetical protein